MRIDTIPLNTALPLRHTILRPGKPLSACIFSGDHAASTRHFGVFNANNKVIAVASVHLQLCAGSPLEPSYRIRAMATEQEYRQQGIGTVLLKHLEDYVKSQHAQLLWANARSSALGFYTRAGFEAISDVFVIEGVGPHYRVAKSII